MAIIPSASPGSRDLPESYEAISVLVEKIERRLRRRLHLPTTFMRDKLAQLLSQDDLYDYRHHWVIKRAYYLRDGWR